MLYLKVTPSRSQEEVPVFVVPTHKRRAAIDGCHRFAGHQGRDRTVSLLKEHFWWPGMIPDGMSSVRNCARCVQFEARVPKPHLRPIITARVLYNEYFSVFGFPRRLMSDQAPEFSGKVIAAMCDLLGVSKVCTSPYHPQSNGAVERAHQTLRRMIGKMDPERRRKWPSHLGSVIIAYNATRSLVTGVLPLFLNVWAEAPPTNRSFVPYCHAAGIITNR